MTQAPQQSNKDDKSADFDAAAVMADLQRWAHELGFSQIGVADIDLRSAEAGLLAWLQAGFHGSMHYMQSHGLKRARPAELVPGTLRVLSLRMDYLPQDSAPDWQTVEWQRLNDPQRAQVSLYARGRDYHKVLRARLQQLAMRLGEAVGPFGYRVFTDSAPVLEVELAARSGIGWRGKHTLTLHRDVGSMFFLGEIYIDLPLPLSEPVTAHCGHCTACLDACPTGAIVAPFRVDARRCISYLTIEHEGAIPLELRPLIGNRLYGCDDCQLICPWNKFAQKSRLADFDARPAMAHGDLLAFWRWDEAQFLRQTEGSAMRRIGHARWQRNLAVVSGNALRQRDWPELRDLLQAIRPAASELLAEHLSWALAQGPAAPTPSAAPPATAAD